MRDGILEEQLADALFGAPQKSPFARAHVTAVSGATVTVNVRGASGVKCAKLSGYAPAVGDKALVVMMPGECVALGKIG